MKKRKQISGFIIFFKKKAAFIFVFFTLFSSSLLAQSKKDSILTENLFEMSLSDLLEVKISSVSKKPENIFDAPQTVLIITEEQIKNRGYIDLEQLMHDIPGFDISRGNGTQYSQIYQRGYRSKNTDRTLLLVDGVEENDLWSGSVWLSKQYPLSNIKRVEVIYGPSSTIYGPNAFIGVINIITKTADDIIKLGNKIGVNAEVNYGSWNTAYADMTISAGNNDIGLTITGRYYKSDEMDLSGFDDWDYDLADYDLDYYKNTLETTDNQVAQKAMDLDNYAYYKDTALHGVSPHYSNAKEDYYVYGKLKIKDFTLGFSTFKRDEGFGAWYRDDWELGPDNGGRWVPKNSFFYAKYEKKLSDKLSITSFTRFKEHKLDGSSQEFYYLGYMNGSLGLSNLTDNSGVLLPDSLIANPYWYVTWYHTYSLQLRSELNTQFKATEKLNIFAGIELRKGYIQGSYLVSEEPVPEETAPSPDIEGGNNFFSTDYGFYTQINYSILHNLDVYVGGRLDYNKIKITGGYGTVFMPKLAFVYKPGNFSLKLIYSEAYKDASFWTKYGTTPGRLLNNPNLKPEKVQNYEFYALWHISKSFFIDLSSYSAFYTDVVGTAAAEYINNRGDTIQTTRHEAMGSLHISGLQTNVIYKTKNYSAYLNYTYTLPYNIENDDEIRVGDIATHKFNAGFNVHFFSKLNINLRMNYVGEKRTGENTTISENPYSKINSYILLNSAINYRITKNLTIQMSVNNILNTLYYDPGVRSANGIYYAARMPQNERNFMFKIYIDL